MSAINNQTRQPSLSRPLRDISLAACTENCSDYYFLVTYWIWIIQTHSGLLGLGFCPYKMLVTVKPQNYCHNLKFLNQTEKMVNARLHTIYRTFWRNMLIIIYVIVYIISEGQYSESLQKEQFP